MEEQIISFETAKLLKEIGVERGLKCDYIYSVGYNSIEKSRNPIVSRGRISVEGQFHLALAPTQSLVQKYLKDEYGLYVSPQYKGYNEWTYQVSQIDFDSQFIKIIILEEVIFGSCEEALENGIQALCTYIKENAITNSPIGSYHWFHTIVASIKHMGEYLKNDGYIETRTLKSWGEQLYKGAESLINGYEKINKNETK